MMDEKQVDNSSSTDSSDFGASSISESGISQSGLQDNVNPFSDTALVAQDDLVDSAAIENPNELATSAGEASDSEASVTELSAAELEKLEIEKKAHIPWYVVHVYSGFEARVKLTLEERIRNASLQDKFGRIIVPQEKVVELVRGEKKTSSRKFFPGYILIQCELDVDTWHLVKDTPKVTGFVGDSNNPMPLSPQEVQNLFEQMEGTAQKARPKVQFENGDSVKVIDGPFADFNGTIDEVKADKGKVRVLINIFGRNTPVELDFVQVEKV